MGANQLLCNLLEISLCQPLQFRQRVVFFYLSYIPQRHWIKIKHFEGIQQTRVSSDHCQWPSLFLSYSMASANRRLDIKAKSWRTLSAPIDPAGTTYNTPTAAAIFESYYYV